MAQRYAICFGVLMASKFIPGNLFRISDQFGNEIGMEGENLDKLKVSDGDTATAIANLSTIFGGGTSLNIFRSNDVSVTTKNEFDLSGVSYTVPAGKSFLLTSFFGSYDSQSLMFIRLKRQLGGSGPFQTLYRLTLLSGGQGSSTLSISFGSGIKIGSPNDVFKITIESSVAKGSAFGSFSGSEI